MGSKFVCTEYRGYLIRRHYVLEHQWWIEKDQRIIGWCEDEADGKRKIDAKLGPERRP